MAFERIKFERLQHIGYLLLAVCLFLVHLPGAYGQVDEGSIIGTVEDASGAVTILSLSATM